MYADCRVYKAATSVLMDNNGCKAAKALEPITSIKEVPRAKKLETKVCTNQGRPQSPFNISKKP